MQPRVCGACPSPKELVGCHGGDNLWLHGEDSGCSLLRAGAYMQRSPEKAVTEMVRGWQSPCETTQEIAFSRNLAWSVLCPVLVPRFTCWCLTNKRPQIAVTTLNSWWSRRTCSQPHVPPARTPLWRTERASSSKKSGLVLLSGRHRHVMSSVGFSGWVMTQCWVVLAAF